MQIYLPIAEISINVLTLLGIGAVVGFLSGLFGVGGGFLMTPLLIFVGVPPAIAVGTQANQMVASSLSGVWSHQRRGNVDPRMGALMVGGGIAGSIAGTLFFRLLMDSGHVDAVVSLAFVLVLGGVGIMMLAESWRAILRTRSGVTHRRKRHYWLHGLPLMVRFPRSQLYASALPPVALGFLVGVVAALMGVGGGFFLIPAMIYLLGMPTPIVLGTSLFQVLFVAASVTILHAVLGHTVDVLLALLLLLGAVVGTQIGVTAGAKLPGNYMRLLLAVLVLAVATTMAAQLVREPRELYSAQRLD